MSKLVKSQYESYVYLIGYDGLTELNEDNPEPVEPLISGKVK